MFNRLAHKKSDTPAKDDGILINPSMAPGFRIVLRLSAKPRQLALQCLVAQFPPSLRGQTKSAPRQ